MAGGSWEQVVGVGEMTVIIFFFYSTMPGRNLASMHTWGSVTLTEPWCPGDIHGAARDSTPASGWEPWVHVSAVMRRLSRHLLGSGCRFLSE